MVMWAIVYRAGSSQVPFNRAVPIPCTSLGNAGTLLSLPPPDIHNERVDLYFLTERARLLISFERFDLGPIGKDT